MPCLRYSGRASGLLEHSLCDEAKNHDEGSCLREERMELEKLPRRTLTPIQPGRPTWVTSSPNLGLNDHRASPPSNVGRGASDQLRTCCYIVKHSDTVLQLSENGRQSWNQPLPQQCPNRTRIPPGFRCPPPPAIPEYNGSAAGKLSSPCSPYTLS